MRIIRGNWYRVRHGAGLHFGMIGQAVRPDWASIDEVESEHGRYKLFDPEKEVILRRADGTHFAMFKVFLEEYDAQSNGTPLVDKSF